MIHGLVKKILEKVFGILLRAEVLMLGHFGPTQTRRSDSTNAKLPIFFYKILYLLRQHNLNYMY